MERPRRSSVMIEVRQLYEALQRFDLLAARTLGLNLTDLRCVNILKDGPLTPGDIGRRLGMTSGSVTAMIDRLEKRGTLARTRSEDDRRSIQVHLNPAFWGRAADVYSELGHALERHLTEAGFDRSPQTGSLLTALANGILEASERVSGGDDGGLSQGDEDVP